MSETALTDEHRSLLEQYAPCLAYDPQDGFRATPAATMTDNPNNALCRKDGEEIAAGAVLQLGTLVDYPGKETFERGDHLVADGDPIDLLMDAMRMHGEPAYPHLAYGRVLPSDGQLWLQYWLWYYDNPKTFAGRGRHQGDWELVQIGLGKHRTVTCSQHSVGETRDWEAVARYPEDSNHPLIYVAPFSHANYFEGRTVYYFPAADHPTGTGIKARPAIMPFGAWQAWEGRWGADRGMLWGLAPKLGGKSPDAPIAQRTRWTDPSKFCDDARRPATSRAKAIVWEIGKRTYPNQPTLHYARLDDRSVEVRYALDQGLPRRSSHILITVNGRDGLQPIAGTRLVKRASREATVHINLRYEAAPYRVWASTFNRFGQRSELSEPIAVT